MERVVKRYQAIITQTARERNASLGLFRSEPEGEGVNFAVSSETAARVIHSGLGARAVELFADAITTDRAAVLKTIGIDKTTLRRRVRNKKLLDPPQAEATIRTMELVTLAVETFGTAENGWLWLKKPHPLLDGISPLEYATNQYGAEKVKSMLYAIRFGGVV